MKALFRILLILAAILVVFFYTNQSVKENELLTAPNSQGKVIPKQVVPDVNGKAIPRPKEGLSTLVGKSTNSLEKLLGKPSRVEPSAYGYEWWVYEEGYNDYLMVGVEGHKATQVYISGVNGEALPFKIGQSLDDIYRSTIIDTEVNVQIDKNIYTFILNEEDMKTRILTMYDGLYAQMYFDATDRTLQAVRFIDGETLVKQQPYDMTYVGDMITPNVPSSYLQAEVDLANKRQLFDLTNVYRTQKGLKALNAAIDLNGIAQSHAASLALGKMSKEGIQQDTLKERLKNAEVNFDIAAENVAEDYLDAPEAINGLLNSEKHRDTLLNEDYNQLGSGAFGKHFSQVFIQSIDSMSDEP
ncbi:CAP domain-containing protein [Viridibacillus sp. NPDC096237]|uniref:CAP domain-containing protein n=1 Tax=Viridibacillus sp. NPDC096237 TaxID=3390721 RepID=UPI003D036CEA